MMTSAQPCRVFSLAEIQSATKNFDDALVVGQGGFGKVYKGRISGERAGHVVAVKRLDSMSNQGEPEFRAEVDMLSKLRHCHLVSLIGYCDENKEMILVYEFMPNWTLYHHLHKANTPLTWMTRLKIAIGAARGLDYLHTGVGTQHGVIHRDVKSSNVLLDENWAAMISDFGLSKVGPTNQSISFVDARVKGTFGYLDPEYFYTKSLTRKTNVYAFGVVLLELLSGRQPVDERNGDECSLVRWAQKCVKERKFDQMVDFNIKGTTSPKCLRQFAQIAYRCVHNVPKERPTMTVVVASLQAVLELQEKSDHIGESSSIMGFNWKVHKYFFGGTKPNSDHSGRNAPKSLDNNIIEDEELVTNINEDEKLVTNIIEDEELVTNIIEDEELVTNINEDEKLVTRDVNIFTYDELKLATRNFRSYTCFYEEVYGRVYNGWLDKMTYSSCEDNAELPIAVKKHRSELFDLGKLKELRHPNLVKLIGYCMQDEYVFLVFELMQRENLKDLLMRGAIKELPLVKKVKILVGIARGIAFLQKTQLNKPWWNDTEFMLPRHKILLDKDFTAKLSDYEGGHYTRNYQNIDQEGLVLECCSYKVIFAEVLTGEDIYYSVNESLASIAQLCLEICNEVDSEAKILTVLKEHGFEYEELVGLI